MESVMNDPRDAGGILKWGPMEASNVVPCLMKRVCVSAMMMAGINVVSKTGIIFIICLVSSTWVTGHRVHGVFGPLFTAALSSDLQELNAERVRWDIHLGVKVRN